MARKMTDTHRHVMPGNLLTGPPIFTAGEESDEHKHMLVGGQGVTSSDKGGPDDDHRHTANGQGMSHPINTMKDTQGAGEKDVKQERI